MRSFFDKCGMLVAVLLCVTSEALGVSVTNMFVGESTMCVDVGVTCTDTEEVSWDTTVPTVVEFNTEEVSSCIVRVWLDGVVVKAERLCVESG